MEFDRKEFIKKLDSILGLIKTLSAAFEDEPERLRMDDIKELTKVLETKLVDSLNYVKKIG